ncbi:MAG: type III pantothenate kinase [Acidimicrobiales bacterium]
MLLAIDAGNTQTVIGLFGDPPRDASLANHWRLSTQVERTADELGLIVTQCLIQAGLLQGGRDQGGRDTAGRDQASAVSGIAMSSSAPRVLGALRDMAAHWFVGVPSIVVEPGTRTGIPVRYETPRDVGADRVANAAAALELYGAPAIVVDFGTATTFDAVSSKGEYLGGAIVPGIEIGLEALFLRASHLRRVELVEPRAAIGRNPAESLQSGAIYGYAALVDGLCARFEEELGLSTIIATGGLAGLIAPHTTKVAHHEPWLTLHGLRLIYQRNQPPGATDGSG